MVNVMHKGVLFVVLACLYIFLPSNDVIAGAGSPGISGIGKPTVCFIENKGQVTDQHNQLRTDIDYKLPATAGLNVFIGAGQIHYMWSQAKYPEDDQYARATISTYRMDVTLEGANTAVHPESLEGISYYERYYTTSLTDIVAHAYNKVVYRNIYPNIDWVLYMKDGAMKYDFIVHPGGDARDIRVKYHGAKKLTLKAGDLTAITPMGSITEHAPYTYHTADRTEVPSAYVLQGRSMSFDLGEYNGEIVIDPSLEWATYLGGSGNDFSFDITTDSAFNVYIVGCTESTTNIVSSGSNLFQTTFAGNRDGYIAKYTPAGLKLWSTYYGNGGDDVFNSLVINSDNDLCISGVTDTSANLASSGSHQYHHGGGLGDCFMAKFKSNGQRYWATYYGGAGNEKVGLLYQSFLRVDAADNIYLVGHTTSNTGIATSTSGVAQTSRSDSFDAFLVKFNKNGVRQWGTYYGGTGDDAFTKVALSDNGFVYAIGDTKSNSLATSGTHKQSRSGEDVLLTKFNPANGSLVWATYYGGSSTDQSAGICLADSNNIYISGKTESTGGIATSGTQQYTFGGGLNATDAFLAKFDSTGNQVWGTYIGGTSADNGGSVVMDAAGNPNIIGSAGSISNIASNDGYRNSKAGGSSNSYFDAFFSIYSQSGTRLYGTYYGGTDNDYGFGISTAGSGHIYICGWSASDTGVAYSGVQMQRGGYNDAFLAKFTPDTSVFIFQPFIDTMHCQGDSFVLNYGVTSPFRSGNTYTVQLSDDTGSFSSPVNIGSGSGTLNGTIKCGLPSNADGTGYRIRVIATMPIDTSYDNGVDITIRKVPQKPTATSNSANVCSSDSLKLNATPFVSGFKYIWTGPGGFADSSTTTASTYRTGMTPATGTGDYIVKVDNHGCSQKDTVSVTIIQAASKPRLEVTTPVCNGDSMVLGANDVTIGADVIFTGPSNFYDSSGPVNTHAPVLVGRGNMSSALNGDYIVTMLMNGCRNTDTVNVQVQPKPAAVTASVSSPLCEYDTLKITGSSSTSGVVYNIYGNGGLVRKNVSLPYSIIHPIPSYSGPVIVEADLNGCTSADTLNVVINVTPNQPQILATRIPACTDDTLMLNATVIDSPSNSWWLRPGSIVDSITNNGVPTSFDYIKKVTDTTVNGWYYVYVKSRTNACYRVDSIKVDIKPVIDINLSAYGLPGNSVCPHADLTFKTSPSFAIQDYSYVWKQAPFDSPKSWTDTAAMSQRPDVDASVGGMYRVKVTSRKNLCEYGLDSFNISIINSIPPPVLKLPSDVCEGDSLQVDMKHPSINLFKLYTPIGDSISGEQITLKNITKAKNEGRYILYVSAGGACEGRDTGFINTVHPSPLMPTILPVKPICEGDTLKMYASSTTSGVTYQWDGPSNFSTTDQQAILPNTIKSKNEGYYYARAVSGICKSPADSVNVVIRDNPKPQINDTTVCENSDVVLSVVNDSSAQTYTWSAVNNSGFSAVGTSATVKKIQLGQGGAYVVSARQGNTGCIGTDTAMVDIIPLPGAVEAYYNEPLCEGQKLVLGVHDTSTNVDYVWSGPPNGSFTFTDKDAFRDSVQLNETGKYTVTVSREGCTRTGEVNVVVKPSPEIPKLTSNSPLAAGEDLKLKIENPTPGASYEWSGPNNFGSRVEDPVIQGITPDQAGTYSLVATIDGCETSGITIVVVTNEGKKEEIVLFPNPNRGTFTVRARLLRDQIMPFEVITCLGTVVYRDIIQTKNQYMEVNLKLEGGLPSGVYIFRIMMSGERREIPFSVVR